MNKDTIHKLLKRHPETKKIFVRVCSSDTLPLRARRKRPCAYVCNTAKANHPGEHWVCFYFDRGGALPEFMDTYGRTPLTASFKRFLGKKGFKRNGCALQNLMSTVCGQYCLYYILMRCRGHSMKSILCKFAYSDTLDNDRRVNREVNRLFQTKQNVVEHSLVFPRLNPGMLL